MSNKKYPDSGLPIRKTEELLPNIFQTEANKKFMSGVVDPIVQQGSLARTVGYVGRRYGKTFQGNEVYLDDDESLRSRYQLETGVNVKDDQNKITDFYDYLDFKNQIKFFNNNNERDDLITDQLHYSWNPPIDWDKLINYREYFWEPQGPPSISITGQSQNIQSTYNVRQGLGSSWIFTPDGATNNPTITLYRGQTYRFNVNSPEEGFTIRSGYQPTDSNYNDGVNNNGAEQGTVIFNVPLDAPDLLYYQSGVDFDRLGQFVIADADTNTFLNVDADIIGKQNYTSSNGIEFTNGLVIEFTGNTAPGKYTQGTWLVEGVGDEITLTKFETLIPPTINDDSPEVLFDNTGFDTLPFDDAESYPGTNDYIVVRKDSRDRNPWSRYNRWFHRDVLQQAYRTRGQDFSANEDRRAKRPIIEFKPNLKLFNHGITAKNNVDFVDDFTTDVFSNIEGKSGYSIDGEGLFNGARVLITNDTDVLANNRIYEVQFITHTGNRQIHLAETIDSESKMNDCVLVRRGNRNANLMYHFDGLQWVKSQEKTKANQPPLFDLFDENGTSVADTSIYPVSSFLGTRLFSFAEGAGPVDKELGFALSYLNIENIGDIQFRWNLDTENLTYTVDQELIQKNLNSCYYLIDKQLKNGWVETNNKFIQPIVDSAVVKESTDTVSFKTVNWDELESDQNSIVKFYLNGEQLADDYDRVDNRFTFPISFNEDDVVSVKVVGNVDPDLGYYEIPVGLQNNPFNNLLETLTLGQAIDHLKTGIEFDNRVTGVLPGNSNLRDIENYISNANRFLKHNGIAAISMLLLCDKNINLIRSLQYAQKSYTNFINSFVKKADELDFIDNVPDFVDAIINDLGRTKDPMSPFADSDMIGSGAYTSVDVIVDDPFIRTFTLNQNFDLTQPSRRAVYVYLNQEQLLANQDYIFDADFGFVTLQVDLNKNDKIQIREYSSTSANYIPSTPTSLGLYKKFKPKSYFDTTFQTGRTVIQGHDGSTITAFNDFKDDLILELEKRIYNNIKVEYDRTVFDIDQTIGGYFSNQDFNKEDLDSIISTDFLRWISDTSIDYSNNNYLDTENSFTYTYSNLTDFTNSENLPGWWRGVYLYIYDTDEPHIHPWEMLGFSEMPEWWEEEYGPAPYTNGNLVLWKDINDGYIRQGERQGFSSRYARSTILEHIPVDENGNLLSPLDSGFAKNFALVNNSGSFRFGDVAPAESAWRRSSQYPFAIIMAMSLLKPFKFITTSLNRNAAKRNILGQLVDSNTTTFFTPVDIEAPILDGNQTAGLINYINFYLKDSGLTSSTLMDKLQGIDVNLSTRLSGFVDKNQQKYLLDSKSPAAANENVFIPPENYDIIFNVSSPIEKLTYSGIVLEKTDSGWSISGYNNVFPFFEYFEALPSQQDPLLTVGGISEEFQEWAPGQRYTNGIIVERNNAYYRVTQSHTATERFDEAFYAKLPKLPITGGVQAFKRTNFNTRREQRLAYGTTLNTIQEVVDFILGYGEYLKSKGFIFDRYDFENQTPQDWTTSAKEFMFWTKSNWEIGSLLTLSPGAQQLMVEKPIGVAENLLDGFYPYNLLKSDGRPIDPKFINASREFTKFTISVDEINDGIYFLQLNYVLKEHIAVFTDRTVFNDVIYDKTTGYRQGRIKSQGFRTVDWDGDYTSPGFLFDNVDIKNWQPFADYNLGDIVRYKSFNWVSLRTQIGKEQFDETVWEKLDSEPEKQLIPNFDYRIASFEDYFDVNSTGISESQKLLARHNIGYQPRAYLQNLSEDPVTQFRLYQGFIQEKGTPNALNKVFNKLSRSEASDSLDLKEEWAIRTGSLGGVDQTKEYEIELIKDRFESDPQLLVISNSNKDRTDFFYRVNQQDFTIGDDSYTTDIIPSSFTNKQKNTAGYVREDQVEFAVPARSDLLLTDIDQIADGDHVWITFDKQSWNVLRFRAVPELRIENLVVEENSVEIEFNRPHDLTANSLIGIKGITNLAGIFEVQSVNYKSLVVNKSAGTPEPEFDGSSAAATVYLLQPARFNSVNDLIEEEVALLPKTAKLFIDADESNRWQVLEKQSVYTPKNIAGEAITDPRMLGYTVKYLPKLKQVLAADPGTANVVSYFENAEAISPKQLIQPQPGLATALGSSFGSAIAVSPDERWLVIGSPAASDIPSKYQGRFSPLENYSPGSVVLHDGVLWEANETVAGDGSTIDVYNESWQIAKSIPVDTVAGTKSSLTSQGMVSIYEYKNSQWEFELSFVSPRPTVNEKFGSSVSISKIDDSYFMFVSAAGANNATGKVYLYRYNGKEWVHNDNVNFRGIYDPGTIVTAKDLKQGQAYIIESIGITDWNEINNTNGVVYSTGDRIVAKIDGDQALFISDGIAKTDPFYPKDSIVWFDGNFYRANNDISPLASTVSNPAESNNWSLTDSTQMIASLPVNANVDIQDSSLNYGPLDGNNEALVFEGDKFGHKVVSNFTGSIIAISAPYSDDQFFTNYKGVWRNDYEYHEGDVVKFSGGYHELTKDASLPDDSSNTSYNQEPVGLPWINVGDSSKTPTGKVFIYERLSNGLYALKQTLTASNIISDDSQFTEIDTGDEFGFDIDIDSAGTTLVVSSPRADANLKNQGSVYVFKNLDNEFRLLQDISSFDNYPNEYFGSSVSIARDTSRIAVGAKNSIFQPTLRFDEGKTTFDEQLTVFKGNEGFTGAAYLFELTGDKYLLTERIQNLLQLGESFGYSIDIKANKIAVGSPKFNRTQGQGNVRLYTKLENQNSLSIIAKEDVKTNIDLVKAIELYDNVNSIKIQDLDFIDPAAGKILNFADKEIDYKIPYDPAIYSIGTSDVVENVDLAWAEKNVGKIWWDTSTAKWVDYEQGDLSYRIGNWNRQVVGSTIDVYEWVESKLLPSEWSLLSDTTEGLVLGISGQPLYPEDNVFSIKTLFNVRTLQPTETFYYYWVRNPTVIPNNIDRNLSASEIADAISNPESLGTGVVGVAASDALVLYNFENIIPDQTALLNIELFKSLSKQNPVHSEYQLLSEGLSTSVPNTQIENKWIDSLVGYDAAGLKVPAENLPEKQKYGIAYRPRQSMFRDRFAALKIVVDRINRVLLSDSFADSIRFTNLNLKDSPPDEALNLYDTKVDTFDELDLIGTARIKQARLRANLLDGEIDTVTVVDPGYGYRTVPTVTVEGNGESAEIQVELDNQGRVKTVNIVRPGKNYTSINLDVRRFGVLVESDKNASGFWGIYSWDDVRQTFFRSLSQSFDTTRYWNFADYWKTGYGPSSRITAEITDAVKEPTTELSIGDLLKINEYGSGGWAVFEKISDTGAGLQGDYAFIGRENGTIQFSKSIYDVSKVGYGYDTTTTYDSDFYDLSNSRELRNILRAIKEDIFIGDYATEYNLLFFSSIRYVLAEQVYVDWIFKSSFLKAVHNVGQLRQKLNFENDNLSSYEDYVNEVKPYKTSIREFVSKYTKLDNTNTSVTDFDLPPYFDSQAGKILPASSTNPIIQNYPWRWWLDNNGYGVIDIAVIDQGSGYVRQPNVLIEGDGTGAKATAYIANGTVRGIQVTSRGTGYTRAPTIKLVGGTDGESAIATATAIIGDAKFRTFDLSIKFDRLSQTGTYSRFKFNQEFVASGSSSVYNLKYPPTQNKSNISVTRNGRIALSSDYTVTLYRQNINGYSALQGRLIFVDPPNKGDKINVFYNINQDIFDAVNRIDSFYSPAAGMKGNDLDQLMTGVDYGGVKIQGSTFEVTGGWDALPWFTDSWDSVESEADFYVVVDGSTSTVELPFVPKEGQEINIYLKRAGSQTSPTIDNLQYSTEDPEPETVRIDDPNFGNLGDSSLVVNPDAVMPTFVGDGATSTVEIGEFIELFDGDTIIFRPEESDGSVTVTDPSVIDTRLSGGKLTQTNGAYVTANGSTPEEIVIDADGFNTSTNTPAPEENVPGQVLDALSLTVFQSSVSGVAPALTRRLTLNGETRFFDIGQRVIERNSVKVYLDKIEQSLNTDYLIDFANYQIEFLSAPSSGSSLEIISIGIGGLRLLDYKEYTGDGNTNLFLTSANFDLTSQIFVTVDGVKTDVEYLSSTDITEEPGKTLVQFGIPPVENSAIKIIALGAFSNLTSSESGVVIVNEEQFTFEGSTRSFDIANYESLERGSQLSSVIVEVNSRALQGVDTVQEIYDGTNNTIQIGIDPEEPPGAVLNSNLKVFVNDNEIELITDFVFDGTNKTLILQESKLEAGDIIKVENNFRTQYSIQNNQLIIDSSVDLAEGDLIDIKWFGEYPSMDFISDEYAGGKIKYQLNIEPVSISFLYVYLNGLRLVQDKDYYVSSDQLNVYLRQDTTEQDLIKILAFGSNTFNLPNAYQINKDMLNVDRFYRYSIDETALEQDLNYFDKEIIVNNSAVLGQPNLDKGIPGMVEIGREKIEYFKIDGNVLSHLRRGALGSSIAETHLKNTKVINQGRNDVIPYSESQDRIDFTSDGSSLFIGSLPFTPTANPIDNWYREDTPEDYYQCNDIEVFVGGRRLIKNPRRIFDDTLGAYSPGADKEIEAEFSVNGIDPFVRLTEPPAAGTRITIIRKTGTPWYDKAQNSATSGESLIDNNNSIAKFIQDKTSRLPE